MDRMRIQQALLHVAAQSNQPVCLSVQQSVQVSISILSWTALLFQKPKSVAVLMLLYHGAEKSHHHIGGDKSPT